MEFLVVILGLLCIAGCGVALYEWRKGKVVLKHDLGATPPGQSESVRDGIRAEEATRTRIMFDNLDH